MDKQIQSMLNAIELFHYARKFDRKKFVIYFEKNIQVSEFIFDFKLLNEAGVQFFIITHKNDDHVINIDDWSNYGIQISKETIELMERLTIQNQQDSHSKIFEIPHDVDFTTIIKSTISLAQSVHAQRMMILSHFGKFVYDQKKYHYIDHIELNKLIKKDGETNYSQEFLQNICNIVLENNIELTVLKDNVGNIFQEIFTHTGSGTMFSVAQKMQVGQSEEKDIVEIMILMKSYIEQKVILPIEREELIKEINQSYSYKIDNQIIAFAMFKHYNEGSEIARFCTLPRYRGKGLAQKLAIHMLQVAQQEKREFVFALSILPLMWKFFTDLGFKEIERSQLPQHWQETYNLNRPSKGFIYRF